MKPRRREELWSRQRVRDGMGRSRTRRARHVRLPRMAAVSLGALGIATVVSIGAPAWARSSAPKAHAARVLNVRDEGRLHYVRSSGEQIIDEGHATGSFPGWVK